MSASKDQPHLLVLPEDDANRQVAIGFRLQLEWSRQRQMQVLPVANGWKKVLDIFQSEHVNLMSRYSLRHMLLLLDFDRDPKRLRQAKKVIPTHLADRVFVLGVWTKPEDLKRGRGCEPVGEDLAQDCRDGTDETWGHDLLRHNANEVERLRQRVRPILFKNG